MEMTMGPASQAWGVWHGVRPPSVRAMMKMVMKKKLRRFRLKLKFSSDAGILRDSRAIEQSRGTFRGVERGKEELGAFCCCKHGKDRPAFLQSEEGSMA